MVSATSKLPKEGRRTSATQRVEQYIKKAIYEGRVKPRERIIEGDIARHLGVSRGPVREAVLRLETEGLIVTTPRRGTFIRDFPMREIEVISRMRGKLEALCVRYMRENMTPEQVASLRESVQKMKSAAVNKDDEQFFYADMELHRKIWKLAGHPPLFRTLNAVMNPFIFTIARGYSVRVPINKRYTNHRDYVEMILKTPLGRVEGAVERYYERLYRLTFRSAVAQLSAEDDGWHGPMFSHSA